MARLFNFDHFVNIFISYVKLSGWIMITTACHMSLRNSPVQVAKIALILYVVSQVAHIQRTYS